MAISTYPVRVEATLDPHISRWLWLVKWLLAIPHYVVLAFLWVAFVVVSMIVFFAIAFTGRYPPSLFEFNVGVLRWSWRVHYYTFGALATDHYPPFTLAEAPDYPAHLDITYPPRLSRGLVWVKWWLLAIPHYFIVAIFVSSGTWAAWQLNNTNFTWAPGGLLGLLVLFAAVALLFTGHYPRQIFDFVLGINRWVLRVAAYAGLMTDDYPPFRLDLGSDEPVSTLTVRRPGNAPLDGPSSGTPGLSGEPLQRGWTGGRVTALVVGLLLALISLAPLAVGGVAAWADNTQRDAAGYLTTAAHSFTTGSYALTSGRIDLGSRADIVAPADILGTVRLRVTATDPQSQIFVGVAPQSAVNRYLAGVSHEEVTNWANGRTVHLYFAAAAPTSYPTAQDFWSAQSSGKGSQTLIWGPSAGAWTIVVMNANASPGVAVRADIGATVPDLGWISVGLLTGGALILLLAAVLVIAPVTRASR